MHGLVKLQAHRRALVIEQEKNLLPFLFAQAHFHGVGGPLAVSVSRSSHELASAFVEAAVQAGHPRNDDFNAEQQEGVGFFELTQRNGMRCSTAVR